MGSATARGLMRQADGNVDLTAYNPESYNILTPALRHDTGAPYLIHQVVEVTLDPAHDGPDFYAAPGSKWARESGSPVPVTVAMRKGGILKIAAAAGLVVDPLNSGSQTPTGCRRCIELAAAHRQAIRCGDCPSHDDVAYRYIGAVRTSTGWRTLSATYEWELASQIRKLKREARKKVDDYQRDLEAFRRGKRDYEPKPVDPQAYFEDRLDQVTSERHGMAETKALLRLVRAICHIAQHYPRKAAGLPFIVVRTDLRPDYADPATRAALARQATQSAAELFGAAGKEAPIDVQVIDALAKAPAFHGAAEEVTVPVDDDQPEHHEPEDAAAAPAPESAAPAPQPAAPAPAGQTTLIEPGAVPDDRETGPASAADCERCSRPLSKARLDYCNSPHGKLALAGHKLCFKCQQARKGDSD